jgi:lambda family phage portal protein
MARSPSTRLNLIDRAVAAIWPERGVSRLRSRIILAQYEAAKPSTQRKFRSTSGEPNLLPGNSAAALRNQMRYLERNHDISRGALNVLVNNTVGPQGIGVEFQPRLADGTIHEAYAAALNEAWRDFCRKPEVTWSYAMGGMQRLLARSLYRDGEVFGQHVEGPLSTLDHGTRVPYSVEMIEADLVPLDLDDEARGIRQGIERDSWGRTRAVHLYRGHPEAGTALLTTRRDTKRLPAERMFHAALRDRIGQLRGVSAFASVITRIEDIKDYEESERIAAKVAAMITGYVKRNSPEGYDPTGMETDEEGRLKPREMRLGAGTIIDTLAVGEEIGLLDPNRPNPNLVGFREGQLRAYAAGIGASFSSIARNYNGTYSAQRQELVEQWVHYMVLCDQFVSAILRPIVERFIRVADLSGAVPMPRDVKPGTHDDVLYIAPSMPWIDPAREVTAWLAAVQAGFASEYEVLRKQGKNPRDVLEQIDSWRKLAAGKGLVFNSDVGATTRLQQQANTPAAAAAAQ